MTSHIPYCTRIIEMPSIINKKEDKLIVTSDTHTNIFQDTDTLKKICVDEINENTTIAINYLHARMFYSALTHINICIDLDIDLQMLYNFEVQN